MDWLHNLIFLSDAGRVALLGAGFILLALVALVAERARGKRARIDRAGPTIAVVRAPVDRRDADARAAG